jgi:threonine/homoserine efflux transporter RhtA
MYSTQLPILVKYRWIFLALAIISWLIGFLLTSNSNLPRALVIPVAGVIFAWTNGIFWAIEFLYPHQIGNNETERISRVQEASKFMRTYSYVFFGFYFFLAMWFTIKAIKIAIAS